MQDMLNSVLITEVLIKMIQTNQKYAVNVYQDFSLFMQMEKQKQTNVVFNFVKELTFLIKLR